MKRFPSIHRQLTMPILCAFSCLAVSAPLSGAQANTSPIPEAADGDLFCKDKKVFFATGEFLYWFVNEGALDYALKMDRPSWATTDTTLTNAMGHYQNAEFDWNPGFRVAFGYFNAPHYWDMYGEYTRLETNGRNSAHEPNRSNEFLNGTWTQPDPITDPAIPLHDAHSHIQLSYQTLDALVSRRFHTNPHLRLNVFGGLTTGLLYQKWNVHYIDTANNHSKLRNSWKFEGLGVRMGMKLDWFMGWDLYLTAVASGSILSGWYQNSSFQLTTASPAGTNNARPLRDVHYHDKRLVCSTQFMAGPSWQKAFDSVRMEVLAGYELTIWNNIHEVYRSSISQPTAAKETFINSSNISLQGLTVRVNVDF